MPSAGSVPPTSDVLERGGRWVTFRVVIDGEAHTFLLRRRDSVNYDSGVLVQVK